LKFDYKLDLFGEKQAVDWSFFIGQEDANIWAQISNKNNTVALEAIKEYSIATGQFKLLANLGLSGKTAQEYFKDMVNIASQANAIMSTQTAVNLGLDPARMSIYLSPTAMLNSSVGIAGVNVSQGAFESIKLGQIKNLLGYDWDRSIYLQKSFEIITGQLTDFSKILGIVYNLDSLAFYQQTPKVTNLPFDSANLVRAFGWKPFAAMLPSMEHTSCLLMTELPTLIEVNAARLRLATTNAGVYSNLPGGALTVMTTGEYDAIVLEASIFTKGFDVNVDLPAEAITEVDKAKSNIFKKSK